MAAGWGTPHAEGRAPRNRGRRCIRQLHGRRRRVRRRREESHPARARGDRRRPGTVVDPDAAKAQIEGAIVFALSAIVYGEITLTDGRVNERNFNDYRLLHPRDTPRIEALLVPSGGFFGGMGEPPRVCVAPALVNALAAATGKRVRALPLVKAGYSLATSAAA